MDSAVRFPRQLSCPDFSDSLSTHATCEILGTLRLPARRFFDPRKWQIQCHRKMPKHFSVYWFFGGFFVASTSAHYLLVAFVQLYDSD